MKAAVGVARFWAVSIGLCAAEIPGMAWDGLMAALARLDRTA